MAVEKHRAQLDDTLAQEVVNESLTMDSNRTSDEMDRHQATSQEGHAAETIDSTHTTETLDGVEGVADTEKGYATTSGGTPSSLEAAQSLPIAAAAAARPLIVVPRSNRRGLFSRFSLIPEVENPYYYARSTKWTITAIVAVVAAVAPMGTNLFYPALGAMAIELHTSPSVANLSVAFYMLAMAVFPLWWSSFSETLGRRTIYITSFTLSILFSILSALSTNIGMLIAMRLLGGGASASVQAVGAGTIADIWEPYERGTAIGIFFLGPLLGPLISPIVGGALSQAFSWRSTMWFMAAFSGVSLLALFFALPETLSRERQLQARKKIEVQVVNPPMTDVSTTRPTLSRVTTTQSVKKATKGIAVVLRRMFLDPLQVLTYLRFPPVAVTVASAAIAFGTLFVTNISIQAGFSEAPYMYSELIVGLLYIPGSMGYIISSVFGGRWVDRIMRREADKAGRYDDKGDLIFLPEDRMRENAWLAATVYPGAVIWFGWSLDKGVYWVVPALAMLCFGLASMLIFGAVTTMLTEFLPKRSASGVAVNNFLRNIFSCIGAIVTQPLINVMGIGWLCTIVGIIAWISANTCIWLLRRNGEKWRVEMNAKLGAG